MLVVRPWGWFQALCCGDLGGENPDEAGSFHNLWAALAAKAANRQPKEGNGMDRRRAPNATHTVVWRTCAPKAMQSITYFEHSEKARKLVTKKGAKYIAHNHIP